MTAPPICIVQARYHSTRLAAKMLLPFGTETLVARGYRIACEAFGKDNCVIAMPMADFKTPLGEEVQRIWATFDATFPNDWDVLGRFHRVAHRFRWHPDSIVVRYTCDDPWKSVDALRRVAAGERLPVEIGGEAFTLAMLDHAHLTETVVQHREHITNAIFQTPPPIAPAGTVWTIDNQTEYDAARAQLEAQNLDALVKPMHAEQTRQSKRGRR